jgi:hypothetical protein
VPTCPHARRHVGTPQREEMLDATLRERVALVATGAALGGAVTYYALCLARPMSGWAKGAPAVRSTAASGVAPGGGAAVYESARAVQEYLAFHFLPAKVHARPHGSCIGREYFPRENGC